MTSLKQRAGPRQDPAPQNIGISTDRTKGSHATRKRAGSNAAELVEGAVEALKAGWSVFPVDRSKRPMVRQGFRAANNDPEVIERWWYRWPTANIGAAVPNGLVVIDVDSRHDGLATLASLEDQKGSLPETLTSRTGGGGLHLYFRHPGGDLRQGAGIIGPGLDSRMPGRGFVILPPSLHLSGLRYKWLDPDTPPGPLPPWLAEFLSPPPGRTYAASNFGRPRSEYVASALLGEAERVAASIPGTRNDTLNAAAFALSRFVVDGSLLETDLFLHLVSAAMCAGLGESEAANTVRSALRARRAA